MKNEQTASKAKIIINTAVGLIIGVGSTLLLMLLFAALMLSLDIDRNMASPFATISAAVGALLSSLFAARKIGDRGYLVGLLVGLAAFAVITAISLIVSPNGLGYNTLFHLIIITLSSVIGGILGVNVGKSKKYI